MTQVPHHSAKRRVIDITADIASLMAALRSGDAVVRENARETLVAMGKPAVAALIKALGDRDRQVRWEAAKALGAIGDPNASPALLTALGDERLGVRWLAAEGLIVLGGQVLEPLLKALLEPANAVWLGEGAHHVIHELSKEYPMPALKRVLAALDEQDPALVVPPAALAALIALRATGLERAAARVMPLPVVQSDGAGVPAR